MNYIDWNNKIFEYFFNRSVADQEVIFCVDEDVISIIGQEYNFTKEESLKSFCKCVAEKIIDTKITKKINLLKFFKEFSINENKIPQNTALIAFLILAASNMDDNDDISDRAYYPRLQELSKIYFEDVEKGFANQDEEMRNVYFMNFDKFENHLNNTLDGEYGIIHFLPLREERLNRDWVGRPIFQSMISKKDYALLTEYFYNRIFNLGHIADNKTNKVKNFSEFSKVFKKIANHKIYRDKLKKKIQQFYDDWDGNVIEYNKKSKISLKYNKNLLYAYKKASWDNNRFNFFVTIDSKNLKTIPKIEFNKYVFNLNDNSKYYSMSDIDIELLSLESKIYTDTDEYRIKRDKKKFIILKKDDEFGYVESNDIKIGDCCSIISTKDFFEENDIRIEQITKIKDCLKNIKHLVNDLFIIEKVEFISYDDFFDIKSIEQDIIFEKGLKNNRCCQYIKEASPIIKIKIPQGFNFTRIKIDDKLIDYKEPIDIRIQYNSLGEHTITHKENKKYEIIEAFEEKETFFNFSDSIYGYNINNFINNEELLNFIKNSESSKEIINTQISYSKIIKIINIVNTLRKNNGEKIIPIITKNQLLKNKNRYLELLKSKCMSNIERKYVKIIESEINK